MFFCFMWCVYRGRVAIVAIRRVSTPYFEVKKMLLFGSRDVLWVCSVWLDLPKHHVRSLSCVVFGTIGRNLVASACRRLTRFGLDTTIP